LLGNVSTAEVMLYRMGTMKSEGMWKESDRSAQVHRRLSGRIEVHNQGRGAATGIRIRYLPNAWPLNEVDQSILSYVPTNTNVTSENPRSILAKYVLRFSAELFKCKRTLRLY